jgi:NAD(P)-dependent dehydrogenase (short-subunit alcohol dehydrogenase family)
VKLGLEGKLAYVTGAATGIGREIVRLLAAEGAQVFAVDIAREALSEYISADGLSQVDMFVADLSTLDGCRQAARAFVERAGRGPDVLINNVGSGRMLGFEALDDDDWHRTFELNFFGMQRTCRELVPLMAELESASVVNIASDLAGQPETVFVDYSATKAAMVNLSRSLAQAYAPRVRVNAVCPGPIWTPLWSRPGGFLESVEQVYGLKGQDAIDALIEDRGIPLARMGKPEEVAQAAVFLASSAASFITGSTLGVNGGTVRAAF